MFLRTEVPQKSSSGSSTKMPERERYAHLFGGNPFANKNVQHTFSLLHWGNQFERATEIDAPEPLVMLGVMAKFVAHNKELIFRKGEAFLAVGHTSNMLYVVPRKNNAPANVPKFSRSTTKLIGKISRTDYWAMKGGKTEHYYYHDHEPPYPSLYIHKSGVGYLRPALWNGKPSYAVGKEGIVG
jgi:hypothetical protein